MSEKSNQDRHSESKDQGENENKERSTGEESKGRTAAEWTTLGISVLILLGLAGTVVYLQITRGSRQPAITIEPQLQEVRKEGNLYYVPIKVTNTGELTAEDVKVELSLEVSGKPPENVGFTNTFLAAGKTITQIAAFESDPKAGKIAHTVTFSVP